MIIKIISLCSKCLIINLSIKMNTSPTSYFIETQSGKLQLTKGTYLTLLKRKSSALKTLDKSKPLYSAYNKKTIKKHYSHGSSHKMIKSLGPNRIALKDRRKNTLMFSVNEDHTIFGGHFHIPLIPMVYDNDNES